jgi:hypothetical protein
MLSQFFPQLFCKIANVSKKVTNQTNKPPPNLKINKSRRLFPFPPPQLFWDENRQNNTK